MMGGGRRDGGKKATSKALKVDGKRRKSTAK